MITLEYINVNDIAVIKIVHSPPSLSRCQTYIMKLGDGHARASLTANAHHQTRVHRLPMK